MIFSKQNPPISNLTLQRQITQAYGELKRARIQQHSGRAKWFEDLMNNGLDILAKRYSGA